MAMNIVNVLEDSSTGKLDQNQKGTGGAAHVAEVGRAGQSHNRYIDTVGNTQALLGHMTWTEAEAVYAIRFRISGGTAGEICKVVFDASPVDDITDDAQAWAWLQAATSDPATDIEYFELVHGGIIASNTAYAPYWTDWFQFSSPLRRADFLAADTARTIFAEVA